MKTYFKRFLMITSIVLIAACGGGSSESGVLFEGMLAEGSGDSHNKALILKHSAGEMIEDVKICAFGECSITDGNGRFGLVAPEEFKSGPVLFQFDGHGIKTETVVEIPAEANEIFLHFEHQQGKVAVHHLEVDGVRVTSDDHGAEHEHSHEEQGQHSHD